MRNAGKLFLQVCVHKKIKKYISLINLLLAGSEEHTCDPHTCDPLPQSEEIMAMPLDIPLSKQEDILQPLSKGSLHNGLQRMVYSNLELEDMVLK